MNIFKNRKFLITCGKGIVPYLEKEVAALGYQVKSSHATGLEIETDYEQCYKLNLCLRTAMHVMFLVKHFECMSPKQLYDTVYKLPWENIVSPDEYISVVTSANTRHLKNSMFASQRVKDAIVDKIAKFYNRRPDAGPKRDNVVINLFWRNNRAWLYIDTSGNKLSDRTYRKLPHTAPLQETLAAAIIMAADYSGEETLINPMCGSGTLAIEAALIALGRAPGLLRSNYGLMHLRNFDADKWQSIRKQIKEKSKKKLKAKIIASDISKKAIEIARKNAMTAGVEQLIEFKCCDFSKTPVPFTPGVIVMNPEYGVRMGDEIQLRRTYHDIGKFIKLHSPGYKSYIFTGNERLAQQIEQQPKTIWTFSNARIECQLLEFK